MARISLLLVFGGFSQTAHGQPPNDNYTNRTALSGLEIVVAGANAGASSEAGEPAHAGLPVGASVWYEWTPSASGWATFKLGHSQFTCRAVIYSYSGSSLSNLSSAAIRTVDAWNRSGGFAASAGSPYRIAVTSNEGDTGGFTFALSLTMLRIVSPTNGFVFEEPAFVPMSISEPNPAVEGTIEAVNYLLSTGGNEVRSVSALSAPFEAAFTNLPPGRFILSARVTNQLGEVKEPAPVRFAVRPTNDLFSAATVMRGYSWLTDGTCVAATSETGEPNHRGRPARASVWWSWVAPASGQAELSRFFTLSDPLFGFGVYTGNSVSNLSNVALQPSSYYTDTFSAVAGFTYHIALDWTNDPGPLAYGGFQLGLQLDTLFLTNPIEAAYYTERDSIPLTIGTSEPDGRLAQVAYYSGTNLIGTASTSPFNLLWANPD